MKVKVGNTVTDGDHQPVMVILTQQDKINISRMTEETTKYCGYPAEMHESEVKVWMLNT